MASLKPGINALYLQTVALKAELADARAALDTKAAAEHRSDHDHEGESA